MLNIDWNGCSADDGKRGGCKKILIAADWVPIMDSQKTPIYDRVMSDGKIVTYAITFDVGKATIKPESMTEIARIQKLMQDNPSLCFEVQGHCDNTGSAATND